MSTETVRVDRPAPLRGQQLSGIMVGEWLEMSAERSPDLACFVMHDGTTRSYASVRERVEQLARAMVDQGVRQGDRVAILATDCAEYVETLLALMKLGVTATPLNFRLAPGEIELLLRTARAVWIFVGERYAETVVGMQDSLPDLEKIVCFDDVPGLMSYDELLATDPGGPVPVVKVDDEDILLLAFTSGTTGLPKGVMQSQRMIKNSASNSIMEYRFLRDEFRYTASPLYHVAGLGLVLKCVARGVTSLILPQWDPVVVLDWIRNGLTGVFLVPTMISSLLDVPGVKPSDFETLQTVFYGAAPMSPSLLSRAMAMMDCDFYNGFGAGTEAAMQSLLTPEDHRRALNGEPHLLSSIGRPGYNVDLQIWDEDGNEVPRGEVGEIVTRSDMVMSGYLDRPDLTAEAVKDGWFRGGDLAWQDEEGYLYLSGRKNDMIIRGGENVYPIEIESVLSEYDVVEECSVIGRPHDHWGEEVVAYLVLRSGAELDEADLRAFCRERLAGYKVPVTFHVVDEMPKNASGKILKRELRTWQ